MFSLNRGGYDVAIKAAMFQLQTWIVLIKHVSLSAD